MQRRGNPAFFIINISAEVAKNGYQIYYKSATFILIKPPPPHEINTAAIGIGLTFDPG
jgi:hypothetical protein